ncbi:MAG: hypothetical protein F4081_03075 [Dehalococcoidia bacterium]|nr:hypothetical protein [Dehalococcoidia bacterium]
MYQTRISGCRLSRSWIRRRWISAPPSRDFWTSRPVGVRSASPLMDSTRSRSASRGPSPPKSLSPVFRCVEASSASTSSPLPQPRRAPAPPARV